jgi:hypothetical protein
MCDTHPEPEGLDQVISSSRLADGSVFTTFNPAAMPTGSQISIGYFPTFTDFALIEAGAALHLQRQPWIAARRIRGPASTPSASLAGRTPAGNGCPLTG